MTSFLGKKAEAAAPDRKAPAVVTKIAEGARFKRKRAERGWSLRQLSAHSGLAISTLSKLENNQMTPTVEVFGRLLAALDTTPGDWFFESHEKATFFNVVRAEAHVQVDHPSVKREVLLGGAAHQGILVMRMEFPAQARGSESDAVGHAGNELIYVIKGTLLLRMKGRKQTILRTGDSIHFSSNVPHVYKAHGGQDCEVIMVWRMRG